MRSWALVLILCVVGVVTPVGAQEYVIGSRDVLKVTVWSQDDLSKDYPVDIHGSIAFPLIGQVKAAGLTTAGLAARLHDLLEKDYLVDPQVLVSVKEYLSKRVHVLGEVERPGLFYLTGPTTLLEILSKAGGLSKTGAKQLTLVRLEPRPAGAAAGASESDNQVLRLDVAKIQAGDPHENIFLQDEDTIFIPKGHEFFVIGEVKKPGSYPLDRRVDILEGITIAGGFTDKAAPGRVRVIRNTPKGQEVVSIDMNDVIKRGQREKAIALQENDVVVVPESFF